MKLKLMTAAAALSTALSGPALANDNTVNIDQLDGNIATIVQTGNNNLVDLFIQDNNGDPITDRNILDVEQIGNGNQIQQGNQFGELHSATVIQNGNANRLGEIDQSGVGNTLVYNAQSSFNNEASEIENNAGNPDFADAVAGLPNDESGFIQGGTENNINLLLTAIDNYTRVEQIGEFNSVEGIGGGAFEIAGTEENLLYVNQDGFGNLVEGGIDGSSNVFLVSQSGFENTVSATQTGLNNTLNVTQSN